MHDLFWFSLGAIAGQFAIVLFVLKLFQTGGPTND
jgi:hypothetical protein